MAAMAAEQLLARRSPRRRRDHTIVVMPAYNAAATLQSTFFAIPPGIADRVILVDDGSRDATIDVAHSLRINVIAHPHNAGYGANQKTCYMEALRRGADVIVMLHPDGQYDPTILGEMVAAVEAGNDIVLGSRFAIKGNAKLGGMPWWKRIANRFLTWTENKVLGLQLTEFHTGYRAYSRRFLQTVPFLRNSNDFVFDTEVLAQAAAFQASIAEVPVATKYFAEASSVGLRTSLVYGFKTLGVMGRYLLHRAGWKSRLFSR